MPSQNDDAITFESPPSPELMESLALLFQMRADLKDREDAVKDFKAEVADLEAKCYAIMVDLNIQRIGLKVDGRVRTAYCRTDEYMSLKAAKKEDGIAWLKKNGWGDLFYETVNSRTMTSALKIFAEEGGEIPDDLINRKYVNRVATLNK